VTQSTFVIRHMMNVKKWSEFKELDDKLKKELEEWSEFKELGDKLKKELDETICIRNDALNKENDLKCKISETFYQQNKRERMFPKEMKSLLRSKSL